jgi:hypothetical protein
MRGTLHKREDNWVVSCKSVNGEIIEYPIHPDDTWKLHDENVDVEFILTYAHLETDPPELIVHASIKNFINPKNRKIMDRKGYVIAYNVLSIITLFLMFFGMVTLKDKVNDAELKIEALESNLVELSKQRDKNDSLVSELTYMRDVYYKQELALKVFSQEHPDAADLYFKILYDTIKPSVLNSDTTNKNNEQLHD